MQRCTLQTHGRYGDRLGKDSPRNKSAANPKERGRRSLALAGRVASQKWGVAVLVLALVLAGCKSSREQREVEKISKNLKEMLKKPVDMREVQADQSFKRITIRLAELLRSPDQKKRAALIKEVEQEGEATRTRLLGDEVLGVGLSPDAWTTDGNPAGLLVRNPGPGELIMDIELWCGAPEKIYPLTATVDAGTERETVVFKVIGSQPVRLPAVAAGQKRLFIIGTDKTWTPGTHDRRKLGVRVLVSLRPVLASLLRKPDPEHRAELVEAIFRKELTDLTPISGETVLGVGLSDGWTGEAPAGVAVWNRDKRARAEEITLVCRAPAATLPLTVELEDGKAKQQVVLQRAGARVVVLPRVPPGEKRLFIITTDKTYAPGSADGPRVGVRLASPLLGHLQAMAGKPAAGQRRRLLELILAGQSESQYLLGEQVRAVGLSADHWTMDGEPAALAVVNEGKAALPLRLFLSCGARGADLPLTALIDDGRARDKVTFTAPGVQGHTLAPVPPGGQRLFVITTDRTWSPGTHDHRQLGVNVNLSCVELLRTLLAGPNPRLRIQLAEAILQGGLPESQQLIPGTMVSLGLSRDRWTVDANPAAVAVRNTGPGPFVPRLVLTVGAKDEDLPVTVFIEDGQHKREVQLELRGSQQVDFPPLGPGATALYIVTTDKTWSLPPQDARRLGVNIDVPSAAPPPHEKPGP